MNRFHRGDPVWCAISYNRSGEAVKWAYGEVTHVFRSDVVAYYNVMRYDTREIVRLLKPEEVKEWDWQNPELRVFPAEVHGAGNNSYRNQSGKHHYHMKRRRSPAEEKE